MKNWGNWVGIVLIIVAALYAFRLVRGALSGIGSIGGGNGQQTPTVVNPNPYFPGVYSYDPGMYYGPWDAPYYGNDPFYQSPANPDPWPRGRRPYPQG